MFAPRYFPVRFFAPRYFPPGAGGIPAREGFIFEVIDQDDICIPQLEDTFNVHDPPSVHVLVDPAEDFRPTAADVVCVQDRVSSVRVSADDNTVSSGRTKAADGGRRQESFRPSRSRSFRAGRGRETKA